MLIDRILDQARQTPDKAAWIHNGQACSYARVVQQIAATVAALSAQGLGPGRTAAVFCDHLADAWVLGIALRQCGVVTIFIDRPALIDDLGIAADIGWVVTLGSSAVHLLRDAAAHAPWRLVELGPAVPAAAATGPLPRLPPCPDPSAGHVVLTSGTTGAYKRVLRDARQEFATLDLHARINGIDAGSVVYVRDFPLWTAGGYRWPLIVLSQGATVVWQQGRDFAQPYQWPTVTHAFATPATLAFLQQPAAQALRRNDGLRLIVTGGPLGRELAAAAIDRLTRQVYTMYGSTEGLTLGLTRIDTLDDLPWHHIHPSREVQVVDEADRVLPVGQVGRVRARMLDGLAGYLGDPEASRQCFRGGWFYPGDLALFRADGRLGLDGRATDVLNIHGRKFSPAALEREIQDRLQARGVCLLSMPGPGGDESLHIVIEPGRPVTEPDLHALAAGPLGSIRPLHFCLRETLPRNTMGKVERLVLRRELQAGAGPQTTRSAR